MVAMAGVVTVDHEADQAKGQYPIFRKTFAALIAVTLLFAASVHAKEPIRIDASPEDAGKVSFSRMLYSLPARKRQ